MVLISLMRPLVLVTTLCVLGCHTSEAAKGEHAPGVGRSGERDSPQASDGAVFRGQRGGGSDTISARADNARIQGAPGAPIWIIEISDFQCPYCRQWHEETYGQVKRDVVDAGTARFAYINFPLPGHRNAWPAAEAAMCAGVQGRFWEMHDALFHSQRRWADLSDPGVVFDSLGTSIGVDIGRLRSCVASHALRPLIQADYDRAVEAGVNATPTFKVGDLTLDGAVPYADLRRAVDSAMAHLRSTGSKP
jgi:protein-disulfide isomerase